MKGTRLLATVGIMAAFFICGQGAKAQVAPGAIPDANDPSGSPGPMKNSDIWQVDPLTGALSVRIPFTTTPEGGRGPVLPVGLLYNSSATTALQLSSTDYNGNLVYIWAPGGETGSGAAPPSGPWTVSGPFIYPQQEMIPDQIFWVSISNGWAKVDHGYGCTVHGPYAYKDENGDSHDMNIQVVSMNSQTNISNTCSNLGSGSFTNSTSDGSDLLTSQTGVTYPNGTVYSSTPSVCTEFNSSMTTCIQYSPTKGTMEDSNGNIASIVTNGSTTNVTDAVGRNAYSTTLPMGTNPSTGVAYGIMPSKSYTVTTYSATNQPEVSTIQVGTASLGSFAMPHPAKGSSEIAGLVGTPAGSVAAVTSVTLPDSTAYQLQYDPTYANISKITFPTGGYVRFVWGVRGVGNVFVGAASYLSTVVVTDAYVSTGSGAESHWSYTYPDLSLPRTTPLTSTETDPDGTTIQRAGSPFIYSEYDSTYLQPTWQETSKLIKNSSGALVESVSTVYSGFGKPTQVATSMYDGPTPLQKQVGYAYDGQGNIIEQDESDWYGCSGSPCTAPASPPSGWLRRTFTSYAYQNSAALAGAHIVNKPSQVLVTDGSGKPASLTNYSYDEAGHIGSTPTGVSTHDDANYGPGSKQPRGNVTTESKCISISGSGSAATCASSWNTSYYYDLTGQVTSKVEGSGTFAAATTKNSWGGQAGGYLYTVAYPNSATDSYTYFESTTGQVNTHKDWNKNQTTYDYTDPLNRIHTITAPATVDGTTGESGQGVTTYNYTDTPGAFTVQVQHTVNTLGVVTSTTTDFDGLGRKSNTNTVSPQCSSGIEVDTTYDTMSRVSTVSNPYCSTSDSTYGLTTFYYDALGRKIQITMPDSSVSKITYGANATEFTDPPNSAGNPQHIQQVNGLGQLTSVCEVSASAFGGVSPASCGLNVAGSGFLTSYTYDPLGNLLNVNQHGIARSFNYDSLSRLTYAMNPEAGAVWYGYLTSNAPCSPNPAVPCSKTDARGVTTTYGYDNLGRLLSKTYNDGATPISCYQYDAGTGANPTGYLTNAWTQASSSGSCNSSLTSFVNLKSFLNYDAVGRLLNAQQQTCVGGKCSGSTPYQVSMTYDLVGNTTALTNSVGANNQPLTLTNSFDVASRPCLTTSSWTANASPNLFQVNPAMNAASPGYSPAGGLQNYFLGSSASTASTTCSSSPTSPTNAVLSYTKRFWVNGISVAGQLP